MILGDIMKKNHKIYITILSFVLLITTIAYIALDKDEGYHEYRNPVNNGLASLTKFDAACSDAGTSVEGIIFLTRDKNSLSATVVADLIVGGADDMGVEFSIPAGLDVDKVLCSFNDDTSSKYAYVRAWPDGGHSIYIAKAHGSPEVITIGGSGTAVIELHSNGKIKLEDIDSLDFVILTANKTRNDISIQITH